MFKPNNTRVVLLPYISLAKYSKSCNSAFNKTQINLSELPQYFDKDKDYDYLQDANTVDSDEIENRITLIENSETASEIAIHAATINSLKENIRYRNYLAHSDENSNITDINSEVINRVHQQLTAERQQELNERRGDIIAENLDNNRPSSFPEATEGSSPASNNSHNITTTNTHELYNDESSNDYSSSSDDM